MKSDQNSDDIALAWDYSNGGDLGNPFRVAGRIN